MTSDPAAVGDDLPDDVQDLPPSCKLVLKVLAYEGTLTFQGIVDETLLPERTTRWALERLTAADIVAQEQDFEDLRKVRYTICDGVSL